MTNFFPVPGWLSRLPKKDQPAARAQFFLRLAALYATPEGSLRQLSVKLDMNPGSIGTYVSRGEAIPPATAIKIERSLGVDLFPRDLLNPEHFKTGK